MVDCTKTTSHRKYIQVSKTLRDSQVHKTIQSAQSEVVAELWQVEKREEGIIRQKDNKIFKHDQPINQRQEHKNQNQHMQNLIKKSKQNVSDIQATLRRYQTESMALCGKTYE